MIYLNIIDLSVVSETYSNILSLIPVENNKSDLSRISKLSDTRYDIRELSMTRVTEIKMVIRDHAGNIAAFDGDNVLAHLIFTNQPNMYK